jgi:hypothetical protein
MNGAIEIGHVDVDKHLHHKSFALRARPFNRVELLLFL